MSNNIRIPQNKLNKLKIDDSEKKTISLRKQANELYYFNHMTKKTIAKRLGVSRKFVSQWTKSPYQDFTLDSRGWPKYKPRKWNRETVEIISQIYQGLVNDPVRFYTGATAIEMEWKRRYPNEACPSLRTIGRILSDLGFTKKQRKGRSKGAARYLCYPEYTIYHNLGKRVLESDFIGRKYLAGYTRPFHFIAFSFKLNPKLRYYQQVYSESADNFIHHCQLFFNTFEKPDFIKVDNALATIGSASGKRNVSRSMIFLLKNQVVPIFAVPRKPFSQASIEGNNSVFSRLFWNTRHFNSPEEIDDALRWFNLDSQWYTGYQRPSKPRSTSNFFAPKIYFIRQVKEHYYKNNSGFLSVLNDQILLPCEYINYFVLAEWQLEQEKILIHFEKEQKLKTIHQQKFLINKRSKEKLTKIV